MLPSSGSRHRTPWHRHRTWCSDGDREARVYSRSRRRRTRRRLRRPCRCSTTVAFARVTRASLRCLWMGSSNGRGLVRKRHRRHPVGGRVQIYGPRRGQSQTGRRYPSLRQSRDRPRFPLTLTCGRKVGPSRGMPPRLSARWRRFHRGYLAWWGGR